MERVVGRCSRIRTCDFLNPNQARYQAALCTVLKGPPRYDSRRAYTPSAPTSRSRNRWSAPPREYRRTNKDFRISDSLLLVTLKVIDLHETGGDDRDDYCDDR